MITNRDIVVIGIQAWDTEIGSNCKDLAAEFAKHNRVLYVNPPLDRITLLRDKKRPTIQKRIRVNKGEDQDLILLDKCFWNLYPKGITESINWIKNPAIYDFLNKRNNRIFAKAIQTAIDRLDFRDIILFNDSSMFNGLYMKELLNPSVYIYYMRDYLIKNPYWRRQGVRLEPKLIAKADLVVNNSVLYTNYGLQYNQHSYMIGQGCDTSMFDEARHPITIADELKAIKQPIIGYVGVLSARRLDISLLEFIARNKPEWSIVLVGPEDETFASSPLHQIENIHFLGPKDPQLMPNYVKGFDVCINPQIVNDATRGNYPRKIDEYLAMGKPTVATSTEAMDYFEGYTYLASSHQQWIEQLTKAYAEDNDEKQRERKAFASEHTWENNVKQISVCLEKLKENQK